MRKGYFCFGCYERKFIVLDETIYCQNCNRYVCKNCITDITCDSCDDLEEDKIAIKNLEELFNELVDLSIVENIDKCKNLYHLIRQNRRYRWIDDIFIAKSTDISES
jgi:hypothetical protein